MRYFFSICSLYVPTSVLWYRFSIREYPRPSRFILELPIWDSQLSLSRIALKNPWFHVRDLNDQRRESA